MTEAVAELPRRNLYLTRLYYFLVVGANGFLFPFISLYYVRQGLSGLEIGLLGTVQASVGLVAAPMWGRWNDRSNRPRLLMQVALVATAVLMLILGRQSEFLIIAFLVGINSLVSAGLDPMSTNMANNVAAHYKDAGFGSIRLWGSMGWSLVTVPAGRLIQTLGIYTAFIGYAVGNILAAVTLRLVPQKAIETEDDATPAADPASIREVLLTIRHSPRLMSLSVGLGFSWLLTAGLYQFEVIYLDELGATETLIGLANALNALVELPGMLWADRLMRSRGPGWLLRMAFLVTAARMVAILAMPTVPMIMVMRLVLGLQYSFYAVGIIGYISAYTNRSYRVTTLALVSITLQNLMAIVGNPLSGAIYDAFGAYWLYVLGLIGSLGGWLALRLGKIESERVA